MLTLKIDGAELFDEKTDRFISIKPQLVKMEHSLLSISKWESKWLKPFLEKNKKTSEELLDYIRCMIINPSYEYDITLAFTPKDIEKIVEYVNSKMTATTITYFDNKQNKKETITSELIYYWMVQAQIPFECEKWHINRLLTLIKIVGAKNAKPTKAAKANYAKMQTKLNAQRRAKFGSKG